jgi:hypothetical protein
MPTLQVSGISGAAAPSDWRRARAAAPAATPAAAPAAAPASAREPEAVGCGAVDDGADCAGALTPDAGPGPGPVYSAVFSSFGAMSDPL